MWIKDWGVHIQSAGSGAATLKYLGAYVARTAISDGRIFAVDQRGVTFRWKDRSDHNRSKVLTLTGSEFVRRYLRHVLPSGCARFATTASAIRPPKPSANAFRSIPECHSSSTPGLPRPRHRAALAALPNLRPPDALDGIDPATLQDPGATTRPSCP